MGKENMFMPKMRGIGVPVNDYFVENFVDIPEFRYNKIPLQQVSKDKNGFHLTIIKLWVSSFTSIMFLIFV